MDTETRQELEKQKIAQRFVESDDWKFIRQIFVDKILDLQNAFNIEDKTPDEMLIDLRARKTCSIMMTEFLRDVEGMAEQSVSNSISFKDKYLVNLES